MSVEAIKLPIKNVASLKPTDFQLSDENTHKQAKIAEAGDERQPSVMEALAADLQSNLKIIHDVELNFSVHKASGRIIVTVLNEATGEKIREIPSEDLLNLAAKFDEMIGLIFDRKC